ncbi:hypothetical protein WAE61_18070 [Comamonadaceae bacterium PP-2]
MRFFRLSVYIALLGLAALLDERGGGLLSSVVSAAGLVGAGYEILRAMLKLERH